MKILVSCLGYDEGKSGLSTYIKNVVDNLAELDCKLTLVVDECSLGDFEGYEIIRVPKFFQKGALNMAWSYFILPFYISRKKYDFVAVLAGNRRYIAFSSVPTLGVIHDLSQYRVGAKYDALRMFYLTKLQPLLVKQFSKLMAISKATKDDMVKHWKISPKKIEVNHNGLTQLNGEDKNVYKKFDLHKYILYVSRIEHPGKNHAGLVKAFEILSKKVVEVGENFKLVLVGQPWSGAEAVFELIKKSPISDRIVLTGFVTSDELASLYEGADVFAFPSFSEGFGLPVIEAMSRGKVCAISNTSSLPEIGGDSAIYFDPSDVNSIASALEKAISDNPLREKLSASSIERSKLFSWSAHAKKIYEAALRFAK